MALQLVRISPIRCAMNVQRLLLLRSNNSSALAASLNRSSTSACQLLVFRNLTTSTLLMKDKPGWRLPGVTATDEREAIALIPIIATWLFMSIVLLVLLRKLVLRII